MRYNTKQDFGERKRDWPNGDFDGGARASAGSQKSVSRYFGEQILSINLRNHRRTGVLSVTPVPPQEFPVQAKQIRCSGWAGNLAQHIAVVP
jgi:hypothetical protein